MLSCKEVTELASEHIDKRLPLMSRISMAIHLLICHHCRRFIRQLRTSITLVKATPKPEIPDDQVQDQVQKLLKISSK